MIKEICNSNNSPYIVTRQLEKLILLHKIKILCLQTNKHSNKRQELQGNLVINKP